MMIRDIKDNSFNNRLLDIASPEKGGFGRGGLSIKSALGNHAIGSPPPSLPPMILASI